jgi:hypothetical protein
MAGRYSASPARWTQRNGRCSGGSVSNSASIAGIQIGPGCRGIIALDTAAGIEPGASVGTHAVNAYIDMQQSVRHDGVYDPCLSGLSRVLYLHSHHSLTPCTRPSHVAPLYR